MTENEIKAWLNRAFYADKKVKAVEMLVQQCRERAQGLSVCYECNARASLQSHRTARRTLLSSLRIWSENYSVRYMN